MENRYRFTRPPRTLTRPDIQLDNFSLVTGNLSPFMNEYQALTNRQPKGTAVMVLPAPTSPLRRVYAAVARALRENGKTVRLYSAG
jgi:flavorubredoxin